MVMLFVEAADTFNGSLSIHFQHAFICLFVTICYKSSSFRPLHHIQHVGRKHCIKFERFMTPFLTHWSPAWHRQHDQLLVWPYDLDLQSLKCVNSADLGFYSYDIISNFTTLNDTSYQTCHGNLSTKLLPSNLSMVSALELPEPYLSALEVWSRQGAIQIYVYLYLYKAIYNALSAICAKQSYKLKFHWDQFPRNFPVANVTGKLPTSYEEVTRKLATVTSR